MLKGSENWSNNRNDIKLLESFYYKGVRQKLGVSMERIIVEDHKNENIWERLNGKEMIQVKY